MKSKILLLLFIFNTISSYAQEKKSNLFEEMDFNGYFQIRTTTNFENTTNAYLKRFKAWIKSKPTFSKHWAYKIKVVATNKNRTLSLIDAIIYYHTPIVSLEIGQFIPPYSLQRFQSEYKLATLDRATPIDVLIPDGTLGVRDIGMQLNITPKQKHFSTHLGIFNGYGIKQYRLNNQGYLIAHKSEIIPLKNTLIGYSLQYRRAENLAIPKLLPDTVLFTGNDFRYNIFAKYQTKRIWIQAEYLTAQLNNQTAYGYYFFSAYSFKKHQIAIGYEKYQPTFNTNNTLPYYNIGYNYYIKGYKIKLSFDNRFQIDNNQIKNYFATIQLQFFIH